MNMDELAPKPGPFRSPPPVFGQHERLAASLFCSFMIPGAGQLFYRRWQAAILWLALTASGYVCFIVPGIVLHVACLLHILWLSQQSECLECRALIPKNATRCRYCRAELPGSAPSQAHVLTPHEPEADGQQRRQH